MLRQLPLHVHSHHRLLASDRGTHERTHNEHRSWNKILASPFPTRTSMFCSIANDIVSRYRLPFCAAEGTFKKKRLLTGAFLKANSLVPIRAYSRGIVVVIAVNVGRVVECSIALAERSSSALIGKVPVEARERFVLSALVLQEQGTLVASKVLQITARIYKNMDYCRP